MAFFRAGEVAGWLPRDGEGPSLLVGPSVTISEGQALSIIERELGGGPRFAERGRTAVSIGDDCAVLSSRRRRTVWTIDACSEGSHFEWGWMSPEDIAHKSFHAAVSDVCAMGAQPTAALVHLSLSERVDRRFLSRFVRYQALLMTKTRVRIVGGNVERAGRFSVVCSVVGELAGPALLRSTARPGDELWLFGDLGLARAGLLLLQSGTTRSRRLGERRCLLAFRRPEARIGQGPRLVGSARACLDVSDGLRKDAQHLARQSGVRVVIEAEKLRRTLTNELVATCEKLGLDPLDVAVQGGEDYALLATGPRSKRPRGARVIGHITVGQGAALIDEAGELTLEGGFEH